MKTEILLKLIDKVLDLPADNNNNTEPATHLSSVVDNAVIGRQVIVRTYSAGVWFGTLAKKSGNEVIVEQARRLWRWHTKKSISLSSVAIHGIDESKSKICAPLASVWLEAIEIIPCESAAIESLVGAKTVEAD